MSSPWFDRPTLTGRFVRLEPLSIEHAEGLFAAGKDPAVWTWLGFPQPVDVDGMRRFVKYALGQYAARDRVPFAQIDARSGEVAGTTSYHDVAPRDRVLRNHRVYPDGSFRDTVVYSVILDEWPAVRDRLRGVLVSPR